MPVNGGSSFMAGDHEQPPSMRQTRAVIVDPLPAAMHHGRADAVDAESAIVVATDRKHLRDVLDVANQLTQLDQLGAMVYEVAPQQHHIRIAPREGIEYLPAQNVGTTLPEVNVADIQQSIGVVPRRESLLADVEGSTQPDFQLSAERTSILQVRVGPELLYDTKFSV